MMLVQIPTTDHLARIYYELAQYGGRSLGEKKDWPYCPANLEELTALAGEMSRFDPRLFEVMVEWVLRNWASLNPLVLRQTMFQMKSPQTVCVIFNFGLSLEADPEHRYFYEYLSCGYKPVRPQLYFSQIYPKPGGALMTRAFTEALQEFLDWGFLARERPAVHEKGQRILLGHYASTTRQKRIGELSQSRKFFTLSDYLTALDHTISRQQALGDLKNFPGIRPYGRGRGSVWKKRER